MSASISPTTGKPYGVELTCHIGGFPRSSFYSKRKQATSEPIPPNPLKGGTKRGPKTTVSDEHLLELIRADLEASPWKGEGHRKVVWRLQVQNVKTGHNRVLRIMRENKLLSPLRSPVGNDGAHKGTIVTQAPGEMWATDATQVMTVDDGNVWVFAAVEHWNAECVGWHVAKTGNRFAALQPIAMALHNIYGSTRADAARGLALRMDHGCQYTSRDFVRQVKHWGISPSFALVGQPETNGVAERFFRTLKEQAIYGRIFKNAEELRTAIGNFVSTYNVAWRLEKNGYLTPSEMRELHALRLAA